MIMEDFFSRSEALLGAEGMDRLRNARVILFGVGGVGSWCADALIRTGLIHLTLVDGDVVQPSNVNRQLPATRETIGRPKVEVLKERLLTINPEAEIVAIHTYLTPRGSMDVHRTSNRAEPFTRQGEGEKGEGYTPSITEIHHIHKLDKPSGTAKTLAEQIENELPSLQGGAGGRLPIESIREGEVPGTHEVKWDSEEDTIIITHIAKGRRGFALGAVLAAEELKQ